MTWNPLRKSHPIQKPTSAHPVLTQSEDRDLDLAIQRLIHVQETIRKLTKEMKKYLQAVSNLEQADVKLSTNLSNCGLAHISNDFRRIVEDYHSITSQMGKTVQELSEMLQKTFTDPLKKLLDEFELIAIATNKREELVATWKNCNKNVKKLQEKKDRSASHIAKLEREKRAEEVAAKELRSMHSRLLVELPWFLEKRLEYIKPSVHALIMVQLDYYGNATKLFTHLMPNTCSETSNSASLNEKNFQATVNTQMNRIKSLTIVKDD